MTPEQIEPTENQPRDVVPPQSITPQQPEQETNPQKPISNKQSKVPIPHFLPKVGQKQNLKTNLLPKPVPSKLLPPLPSSAVRTDERVESKVRTLPEHVSLHPLKDRTALPKLGPSQLPQHCIKPEYDIFSNDITKPNPKRQSGICKLDQMRYKKQQMERTVTSVGPRTSSNKPEVRRIPG